MSSGILQSPIEQLTRRMLRVNFVHLWKFAPDIRLGPNAPPVTLAAWQRSAKVEVSPINDSTALGSLANGAFLPRTTNPARYPRIA
jgi:hypothetical protein